MSTLFFLVLGAFTYVAGVWAGTQLERRNATRRIAKTEAPKGDTMAEVYTRLRDAQGEIALLQRRDESRFEAIEHMERQRNEWREEYHRLAASAMHAQDMVMRECARLSALLDRLRARASTVLAMKGDERVAEQLALVGALAEARTEVKPEIRQVLGDYAGEFVKDPTAAEKRVEARAEAAQPEKKD